MVQIPPAFGRMMSTIGKYTSISYQRRGKSRSFFFMKVWYIILPKILNNQWIIKIQKVLETRDLTLSETTVSSTFPSLESFWKVSSRKKSSNSRVPYTPSLHRYRLQKSRNTKCIIMGDMRHFYLNENFVCAKNGDLIFKNEDSQSGRNYKQIN